MAPLASATLALLRQHRLVSVIRAATPDAAYGAALAVIRGGIPFVEITYSVPDAPSVMARLRDSSDSAGAVVGAGTVLTAAEAHAAIEAGARFLIAPNCSPAVAQVARESGVLYCPGAYTTTEIIAAMDAGAHIVKVYPVGIAGGPGYIQVIRDPLPNVPMLAAGGTNLENCVPFLEAGAQAIGLGAALADPKLALAGDFATIEARAKAFVARVGPFASPGPGA
jgi:2-dehydro-3-deoxyphosphogluconate aldolase/(4S)-4-hydroxy-2-oxoglutarate aldolase